MNDNGLGKLNNRELLVKIYERVHNMSEDLDKHKASHKWFVGIVFAIPTAIGAFFKFILDK
jgi:hypothetical protein